MMWNRMRRFGPLLLAGALCLAPLTAAEAGGVSVRGSRLVASQGLLDWAGQLWQRLLSVWGQEGATIDPNGNNPPVNGNGSTTPPIDRAWGEEGVSIDPSGGNPPINGNGSTATIPPIDPGNG